MFSLGCGLGQAVRTGHDQISSANEERCYSAPTLSSDRTLSRYLRMNVDHDDIVDALAAAVAGYRSRGNMTNVPEPPEIDPTGLPMRMAIPTLG